MPEESDPATAIKKGELKFVVEGERLHGGWVLVRIKNRRPGDKKNNWLLIKHRDEFARDNDGDADKVLSKDRSAASGPPWADRAARAGRRKFRCCRVEDEARQVRRDLALSKVAEQASTPARRPAHADGLTAPGRDPAVGRVSGMNI